MITLAILLVVAAGIGYWFYKTKTDSKVSGNADPSQQKPATPKESRTESILEGLINLNINLRTGQFPSMGIQAAERIIDLLVELLPQMRERYPTEELTWEVSRIAEHHLPGLIKRYGQLNPADKASQEAKLMESLTALVSQLMDIQKLVSADQQSDFGRMAETVKLKYGEIV